MPIGFLGIELRLDQLASIAINSDQSLFAGAGKVSMISLDGTLLASDSNTDSPGQPFRVPPFLMTISLIYCLAVKPRLNGMPLVSG